MTIIYNKKTGDVLSENGKPLNYEDCKPVYEVHFNPETQEKTEELIGYTMYFDPEIFCTRVITDDECTALVESLKKPKLSYSKLVDKMIRERYSQSEEFAILRQRDEKPEEFADYYAFCEECKRLAKERSNRAPG